MAKSTASELVRGAGMAADVWTRLDQAVRAQGGNEDDLHLLARDEGMPMITMIAGLLVKAGAAARNVYPVTVDYNQPLTEMVAAGKYGYANEYITAENFLVEEGAHSIVNLEEVLVHFDRDIESDDAVKELEQMGLRPATMRELLAFGAKFPEIQREFPIAALGQSWVDPGGYRVVGCLSGWGDGREVGLVAWAGGWGAGYRFLAVRKSTPSAS